jgi:hypothetical protein
MVSISNHGVMRAKLVSQRERIRVTIDDDDPGSGQGVKTLDADVSEAAGADHDTRRARIEQRNRLAYSVVGRDTGVGQGGDVLRPSARVQLHAGASRGEQVFRHAAVV